MKQHIIAKFNLGNILLDFNSATKGKLCCSEHLIFIHVMGKDTLYNNNLYHYDLTFFGAFLCICLKMINIYTCVVLSLRKNESS